MYRTFLRSHKFWLLALLLLVTAGAGASIAGAAASSGGRRADVDGDKRADKVTLREKVGTGWFLDVLLATGRLLSTPAPGSPSLMKVGNVDGRAGDELFIAHEEIGQTSISIYTYRSHALASAGPTFTVGTPGPGVKLGVACSSHRGRYFVTQYGFNNYNSGQGWTQGDDVYLWKNGDLRKSSSDKAHRIKGAPPKSRTGLACGHRPAAF